MAAIPETLGKYQVLGPIGKGGMGEVFKAWQPDLNRPVAIKTLLAGEQASEEFLERFQREARLVAKLSHPNIVPIYDSGAEGRLHYFVMEYVDGRSLREILLERRLDPEKALRIAYTVARTLDHAHRQDVVHRDVKPANIMIDREGRVRILDFGLAKSLSEGKGPTVSNVMAGTPCYMSPEQAFGSPEELDARTDVYSLGAVLYEMLAGRPPFDGGTVLAILRKLEDADPAPPGVSPAVDALVLKALAKDRERRFQGAGEMAEALKACLRGVPAVEGPVVPPTQRVETAAPPPAPPLVVEIPRRAAWVAAAVAILAAGGLLAWRLRGAEPVAPPPEPRPVSASDPAADLRALLQRKGEVPREELAPYREDPQLRRLIADHHLSRGQFSRALEDLRGYDRAIMELASARALQRFAAPSLFRVSIPQPLEVRGPERLLMAAVGRHLEGKADAARQKLKAAVTNDALPAHVLLVRAHIELSEILEEPQEEGRRLTLDQLRRDLEAAPELYLRPLRAIAAQAAGDEAAARETANELLKAAPGAAETFLTSAVLFFQAGRYDLAADELEEAVRLDPRAYDGSVLRAWFRWMQVLHDPANEKLDADPGGDAPGLAEMQEVLDARLAHDHLPAALLLRAAQHALGARWEAAEEDLRRLERRVALDRIVAGHDRLQAFVSGGGSRSRLVDATAALQLHLGASAAALASSEQIDGADLQGDERRDLLRENHLRVARLVAGRPPKALARLEEALKLGKAAQELRDDEELASLRSDPRFEELLRRYENR